MRLGVAAALAVLPAAGTVAAVASRSGSPPTGSGALPGLQTGPAPWGANTADLAARLRAIGLPPLSPTDGTAVHAPLHVHDISGVIHVESPTVRSYSLGQFFTVWGVRFTRTCLGGYCAGGDRRLRVYVNGAPIRGDPTTLTLEPHQEILVAFGTAAQLPSPIPSSHRFPPCL